MDDSKKNTGWGRRLAALLALLVAAFAGAAVVLLDADGPTFVFGGGPFRSGEEVALADLDWTALDSLHELEMEIVSAESSRVLWFSVHDGVPYVACDLDCVDGVLSRWPQQIDRDNRVVIRIDGKRANAKLIHVPHDSTEYAAVRVGRDEKYSGDEGGRAATETAAHGTVVGVGEMLTGRAQREEPGDKLYRIDPR